MNSEQTNEQEVTVDAFQDAYAVGELRPGVEPKMYIPAWYKPHSDLSRHVTQNGESVGFRIGQVLPERRWAIQENGELLEQGDFERQYIRYIQIRHAGDKIVDPSKEAIPGALKFVDREVDEITGRGKKIGFNPNKPAEKVIEAKHNQDGEVSEHWLRENKMQGEKLARLQALRELVEDGTITPQQYSDKTKALLMEEPVHEFATQDPVETQMLPKTAEAPCGKVVKARGVKPHIMRCKAPECEAAREA